MAKVATRSMKESDSGHGVHAPKSLPSPYFESKDGAVRLYLGDSVQLLPLLGLESSVDVVFADPPYFLSNGGVTCQAGRMVSVNKGDWDRLTSVGEMHEFNRRWLSLCRTLLQGNGSMWVSGTRHVIYSVGFAMQQLEMKVLNDITWEKPNPPPNLSCRYFTHATETLLWAAKSSESRHYFNYPLMRAMAGGRQMKSVWRILRPAVCETRFGRHPTQKPLALLERVILASSRAGELVLDPFVGSGTTGVAAVRTGRRFVGVDNSEDFLKVARQRLAEALDSREKKGE